MDYIGIPKNSAFLEHYGRLGMKWGQHIFGDKSENRNKNKIDKTNPAYIAEKPISGMRQVLKQEKAISKAAKKKSGKKVVSEGKKQIRATYMAVSGRDEVRNSQLLKDIIGEMVTARKAYKVGNPKGFDESLDRVAKYLYESDDEQTRRRLIYWMLSSQGQ